MSVLNATKAATLAERTSHNLPESFRKLYYHLYTNSKASRAETIIEDLSLVLLVDLANRTPDDERQLREFRNGTKSSEEALLPILRREFPSHLGKEQQFSIGDQAVRDALGVMEGLDIAHAPAHSIGEAFQALIGPRLRGEKGQFFTPKSLVRAMVRILDPKPNETVLDPAAGTGGFLAETHIYQVEKYGAIDSYAQLVGGEKDNGLARLGNAMLTALCRGRGHIYNLNSLDVREWEALAGKTYAGSFDVVLTNPPFGSKIGLKDPDLLRQYDFGHLWSNSKSSAWAQSNTLSASEDPQILFLEMCVRALKPGGRLGIVLPEGMFGNRQSAYVWQWLRTQGEILALLDCPRTTFQPGTDTKTNVLFFRRGGSVRAVPKKVALAVAVHCGHDRRGRSSTTNGDSLPDDFERLARSFGAKGQADWRFEPMGDSDYLVPRYHYYKSDVGPDEPIARGAAVYSLAELVKRKLITIRKGHEVGSEAYGTGDVPFVRTSDIANFEVSADPTKAVSEEVYTEYAAQQNLRPGDILMVVDGRYKIGTTAILNEHSCRAVAQSHLRIISATEPSKLDPYALLYALNLPSVKLHLRGLVFIQSTLGTLGSRLMELKIPLLIGDGPWAARVEAFRETLQNRGRLLADLQRMAGPEVEL